MKPPGTIAHNNDMKRVYEPATNGSNKHRGFPGKSEKYIIQLN